MRKHVLFILSALNVVSWSGGCGGEKGGDHVPTDKTYPVAVIPVGASSRTITPREYETNVLGRFVHIAENYRLCLIKEQFTETELTGLQAYLSGKSAGINQYGLESLINQTFATLQSYDSNKPRFSTRTSLQVVWNDGGACDFLAGKLASTDFPFNHADFSGRKRVLFDAGQLTVEGGGSNAIPVGYLIAGSSADDRVQFQKLVASYLGFAESQSSTSYIHPEVTSASASSWNVVDSSNQILAGDDSLKIYSFAAAWYDIVKPTDLDRFHYYEDLFSPGAVATDPLLTISSAGTVPTFLDLPGNRYLNGARKMTGPLTVCFKDDADLGITAEMVTTWMSFASVKSADGLHGKLNVMDPAFSFDAAVSGTGCQLWIAFRNESQYPFAATKANGLYAQEGRVAGANNIASTVPVIYVNAANLSVSVDPILMTAARHVSSVMQHEYAHFLGFKHSAERSSLHAPAGTGTVWTEGDKAIFAEYLKFYK